MARLMLKTGGVAAALTMAALGAARAQDAPAGTPPAWGTLVRCAQMSDEQARLGCYDTAMRAAGYAPKPEAVEANKRERFGLSAPQLQNLNRQEQQAGEAEASGQSARAAVAQARQEEKQAKLEEKQAKAEARRANKAAQATEGEITVQVAQVATLKPSDRLVIFTTDGAIWEQTETDPAPLPASGDTITIHKSTFGGYLCDVSKYKAVRCKRDQ